MLQALFLWFYCLSISDALMLIIVVSAAYLLLRFLLGEKRLWRPAIAVFFLAWLAVIAAATLMDRTSGTLSLNPELIPFHSYRAVLNGENKEILRSNLMNVILFYPAGLLTYELLPRDWRRAQKLILTMVLFALLSAGIEVCQYYFALGQAEVDDVIHNTLGTLIGAMVSSIHISGRKSKSSD